MDNSQNNEPTGRVVNELSPGEAGNSIPKAPNPAPPPVDTVGGAGLDTLGGGMRKMVELVNKLRAGGIEGLGLGLPRIVVVGNQSSGKSSLIEAISGIKVPRYTGTCTRCPLEINLSEPEGPASKWQCKISLRFNKAYAPQHRDSQGRNNPWVDRPVEQHLFLNLSSKEEVEGALMRAQSAVLNPSKRWEDYAVRLDIVGNGTGAEDYDVKFSPNVVCLEIAERGLPNLAFIDLPGVIQTTETDSEDYLIDLVTNLVKEYVKGEECLILLAMTMKDDAVNQSAARLAREMGEERTVGALTKPDTVCPGEFKQWIEILRGKAFKLKHGYFVTKQPSQDQLVKGITHAEARRDESEFFAKNEPWATELSDMSHRFGTVSLTKFLAQKLGETIRLRLPGIVETIQREAENVQAELDRFPPPAIDNHFHLIQTLITKFASMAGEYLQGGHGVEKNRLQMSFKHNARELGRSLDSLIPKIECCKMDEEKSEYETPRGVYHEGSPCSIRDTSSLVISLLDDGDDDYWNKGTPTLTPKKSVHQMSSGGSGEGSRPSTHDSSQKHSRADPEGPQLGPNTYSLMQINKIMEFNAGGQIPHQVDSKAIEYLARRALKSWENSIHGYLDACQKQLLSVIHAVFVRKFDQYKKTPLHKQSYHILQDFLDRRFEMQVDNVMNRLYKLEKDQIATLNESGFKVMKAKHHQHLLEVRARNREEQRESKRRKLGADATLSVKKRAVEEKKLQQEEREQGLGNDQYAKEIELVAEVRAYYELATRRFVDNIFISVWGEWVNIVRLGLAEELWTGLGFEEEDSEVHSRCRALLEEDPKSQGRRRSLELKREQLRKAMDELDLL